MSAIQALTDAREPRGAGPWTTGGRLRPFGAAGRPRLDTSADHSFSFGEDTGFLGRSLDLERASARSTCAA